MSCEAGATAYSFIRLLMAHRMLRIFLNKSIKTITRQAGEAAARTRDPMVLSSTTNSHCTTLYGLGISLYQCLRRPSTFLNIS